MQITILFFGIVKDITTKSSDNLLVTDNLRVFELKKILLENYPTLKKYANFSVAVNESYAEDSTVLKKNDIVAIIPPVSGG